MRRPSGLAALPLLLLAAPSAARQEDGREPKQLGIVERAGRELVQIDVTVTGDPDAIATLTEDDFQLSVGGRIIDAFLVDRVCAEPNVAPSAPETAEAEPPAAAVAPAAARANYLFYFDQAHLRMGGRVRAHEMAPELIDGLVVDGARGMVVSAGRELRVFAGLTDDREALKAAVAEVEHDPKQWVVYPAMEDNRVEEVLGAPATGLALATARRHQQDEARNARRALKRFEMALARFSELDPPKIAVYFADTMRMEPGKHYLYLIGGVGGADAMLATAIELSAFGDALTFDGVIDAAAAHGVRLYTVHAEGLVARFDNHLPQKRYKDAQNAMAGLALETGGRAFLNGVPPKKMVRQIREDLSCVYLISFDASKLPEDKKLTATVRVTRPGVRARSRGRVVVQSESARVTTRLLTSFVSPEMASPDFTLGGAVVPTGFEGGRFGALVQISIGAQPFANAEWDLGASLVAKGTVQAELQGHVRIDRPGKPIVLEGEMRFPPGEYEIVAVAREAATNQVGTLTLSGDWPKPGEERVTLGPIAVLQPVEGTFVHGDEARSQGLLGADEEAPVDADRPVRLVGLVCRKRGLKETLRLERTLRGTEDAEFPVNRIDFGTDRCVRVEDVIPAGTMAPGTSVYEIRAFVGDEEAASRERELIVEGTPSGE